MHRSTFLPLQHAATLIFSVDWGLDAISVVIQERGFRQPTPRLEILNEEGVVIEALDYISSTEDQDRQLQRLYVLARRSALDIQSTLEKLARALEL